MAGDVTRKELLNTIAALLYALDEEWLRGADGMTDAQIEQMRRRVAAAGQAVWNRAVAASLSQQKGAIFDAQA